MAGFASGLYQAFLNWLYRTGDISVPSDFHERCGGINLMLDNDISGIVNTILDYSSNSASNTDLKVECSSNTLEKLLNLWLEKININVKKIPSGVKELSKEYYKERWQGSSLCLLRVKNWETIKVDNVIIQVPTTLFYVNGSSVYVKRPKTKNYKLGTDAYFLDKNEKFPLPGRNEEIVIQKPFDRWFDCYSTPYLIRKGIYKNWKAMKVLQEKSDEVITKVLPYLFVIQKGTENLAINKDVDYSDDELKELALGMKTALESYKSEKGKTPLNAVPFDQKYEHLIPELRKILREDLYNQGYRTMLSGLGFVDVIQGISSSRRESILNPKPFLSEVNAGVDGFKSMLSEVIKLIIAKNTKHTKLFNENKLIKIVNSPLRINIEEILEMVRSGYDRGLLSKKSFIESLGFDFRTEKERRVKELNEGDEDTFYPPLIQNREDIPDRIIPSKPRKETNENQNKKKNSPESKNYQADLEIEYATLISCKKCSYEFIYEDIPEAGMGYIKCPKCQEVLTQKDGEKARVDITKNYIRLRQIDPKEFQKDSFRIITLSKSKGIKAVIGRLKGKKTTTIQSYLFEKNKWTVKEAQEWVKKNKAFLEEYVIAELPENIEKSPYTLKNAPKSIKKLSKDLQELWVRVWNETYDRYHDEAKAHRTAWYVVNKERNKKRKQSKHNKVVEKKREKLVEEQLKLINKLKKQEGNDEDI